MPEFKQSISPVDTSRFGSVRAVRSPSNTDVVGKALSDVVQGAIVFGKASAKEAGTEAALKFEGADQSLEEVNATTDRVRELMKESLSVRTEELGTAPTKRQIEEDRDKALSSLDLTKRNLESLFVNKVITRTEANARLRMEAATLRNQGANYLFPDEFSNAIANVTGGARGSSTATLFPETVEEARDKAILEQQIKAQAAFEGELQTLQLNNPHRSKESLKMELQTAGRLQAKIAKYEGIKAQRNLTGLEHRDSIETDQAAFTQSFAKNIGEMADEKGMLDSTQIMQLKAKAAEFLREQTKSSAEAKISQSDRETLEKDFERFSRGIEGLVSLYDGSAKNKKLLEDLKITAELYGAAANPEAYILGKANPTLLEALNKMPKASKKRLSINILGEEGYNELDQGRNIVSDMASLVTPGKMNLNDKRNPSLLYSTREGREAYGLEEALAARIKLLNLDPEVSSVSFSSMGGIFSSNATVPSDNGEAKAALELFDNSRTGWFNSISILNTAIPSVKQVGQRTILDIDQRLIDNVPGLQDSMHNAYNAMRLNPWLWNGRYEDPVEAFNEYMSGSFSLAPKDFFAPPKEEDKDVK